MNFDKTIPYEISYKSKFKNSDELEYATYYDLFISAYNNSQRVQEVFSKVKSNEKHWLIFAEYGYTESEIFVEVNDNISVFKFDHGYREGEVIRNYFDKLNLDFQNLKIGIDITGFIRPHLLFLIKYLNVKGLKQFDCLYSDPVKYKKNEETRFSDQLVEVRQVDGYQGGSNPDNNNDYLFIAAGFDYNRISNVSENKKHAKKIQIFGLPSLQPDMFQQNIVKAYKAEEELSSSGNLFLDPSRTIFAPANDPFVTAEEISRYIKKMCKSEKVTNIYLAPLSTKVQTLGIALFYIGECLEQDVSIIFPFCSQYSRETSEGLSKVWLYTIDFNLLST